MSNFALKTTAAALLEKHDAKLSQRVGICRKVGHGRADVSLLARKTPDGSIRAGFGGLTTCGSVWACPCCSAAISEKRRQELNHLTEWSRVQGHHVAMLTLTARHRRGTDLRGFLNDLKEATRRLKQSKGWRALGLVGTVTATEVRHSDANGWHPHFHILLILPASFGSADAAGETVRALAPEWLRSLGKVGRTGGAASFDVSTSAVGEYIAKFGAAEEISLGAKKSSGKGSLSPFQILAEAREGCAKSCALFVEYALVFKGKRQLTWSRGLKALCGVDEVDDADASENDADDETIVLASWVSGTAEARHAIKRQCLLMRAAEAGADIEAILFGPSDADAWRAERAASAVVDGGDQ